MSATPMAVQTRPFAVEPVTNIMLPDGIFDNALYKLMISCHYTNTSNAALTNVTLYLESIGDPGIVVTARTYTFASVPAGASVLVQWQGKILFAYAGETLRSFVAQADGFSLSRLIPHRFIPLCRSRGRCLHWACPVTHYTMGSTYIY